MMNNRRIIPLILFVISSFMLWDAWQAREQAQHAVSQNETTVPNAQPSAGTAAVPVPSAAPGSSTAPAATAVAPTAGALKEGLRVTVTTDVLEAEIDTDGADLRTLKLLQHRSAQDSGKPVTLFQDDGGLTYVAQSGLIGPGLPNHTTLFQTDSDGLALKDGENSVDAVLKATVPGVAEVTKTYHFKRGSYVVTLDTTVRNLGTAPLTPDAYFQFLRVAEAPPGDPRFVSTFTGPAVYTESGKFQKINFSDVEKGKQNYVTHADNGWIAMLQHYFVAAWLPSAGASREFYTRKVGNDLYTAGLILPVGTIQPGASATVTVPLYAGPQEGAKLKALAPGLDLTIDYGWLTIIATPLFYVLSWIHGWVGNWGFAIILLTVLIKAIFFPLSAASYKSMAKMRVIQPKLERLKQQYGDDRAKLNQAMMEMYKTEKINPLGGCLPMLVQIPVFIALYWVLLGSVELRHAPFIGWIHDLSAQDPFYILPVLMTISMFVQQRMSPKPPDPVQAKVMMIMPLAFSFMFFFFPAGLVLYWVVNNVLSIAQQWQITRMMGDGKR
jgi:YidC/Oxa1 family membrane protein insertase